jgi:hypothetical protein
VGQDFEVSITPRSYRAIDPDINFSPGKLVMAPQQHQDFLPQPQHRHGQKNRLPSTQDLAHLFYEQIFLLAAVGMAGSTIITFEDQYIGLYTPHGL